MPTDIQEEGRIAYKNGESLDANPHAKGSEDWYSWITGGRLSWELHEDIVEY